METHARQFSVRGLMLMMAGCGAVFASYKAGVLLYQRGGISALVLVASLMGVSYLAMFGVFFSNRPRR